MHFALYALSLYFHTFINKSKERKRGIRLIYTRGETPSTMKVPSLLLNKSEQFIWHKASFWDVGLI